MGTKLGDEKGGSWGVWPVLLKNSHPTGVHGIKGPGLQKATEKLENLWIGNL